MIAVAVSDGNFDAVLPGCLENLISFCWAPAERFFYIDSSSSRMDGCQHHLTVLVGMAGRDRDKLGPQSLQHFRVLGEAMG